MLEKLDEIQSQLRSIEKKIKSEKLQEKEKPLEKSNIAQKVKSLKAIRSLKELLAIGFQYEGSSSELRCMICQDTNNTNPEKTTDQGVFFYSNNLVKEFEDQEFLPREFISLKKSIKCHLTDSVTHRKNVQAEEQRQLERSMFQKNNETA